MTGNGGPLAALRGYLEEIFHYDDELATLRGEFMENCKGPREAIAEIKQRAKDNDIDMPAFATLLKEQRDMRKHERRLAKLDLAQQARYAEMTAALGEFGTTPLGLAAIKKAEHRAGVQS